VRSGDFNVLGVPEASILYHVSSCAIANGQLISSRLRVATDATQIVLRFNDKVLIASATGARIRSGEFSGQSSVQVLIRVGLEHNAVHEIPIGDQVRIGEQRAAE